MLACTNSILGLAEYRFVRDAEGALRVLVREPGDAEGVNRHGIIMLMLDGNS